jgi:hypothetical protein
MTEKIGKLFTKAEKTFNDHVAEHADCPAARPDRLKLGSEMRGTMLYMLHEARRLEVLDPDDAEMLERLVGTDGAEDNFGWPEGVLPWQKWACAVTFGRLADALNEKTSEDESNDPLMRMLDESLGESRTKRTEVPVPPQLAKMLLEQLSDDHVDDEEEESVGRSARDWQRAGYL